MTILRNSRMVVIVSSDPGFALNFAEPGYVICESCACDSGYGFINHSESKVDF